MKFSDEFLKSYANLFGQQETDAFLVRNLENYVSPQESEQQNSEMSESDQPEKMADARSDQPASTEN